MNKKTAIINQFAKLKFIFLLILMGLTSQLFSQFTSVPDTAFEKALINSGFDDKMDGKILKSACSLVDTLKIANKNLKSLSGIQDFINLKYLDCSYNQLKEVDLSHNDSLNYLNCSVNYLTELNTDKNAKLYVLWCFHNQIKKLDLSTNKELLFLRCQGNALKKLDLSLNKSLLLLFCFDNRLKDILVSECKSLEVFDCSNNEISNLDISANLYLSEFSCKKNNLDRLYISKLDVHDQFNDKGLYLTGNDPLGYILIQIIRK